MQSDIVKAICGIGIFIICAQMMIHFRPDNSYEKYLKMLVSAMILLLMLRPLAALLHGGEGAGLQERVEWFARQLADDMEEAAGSMEQAEKLRERLSLEEVQRRLEEEAGEAEGERGKGREEPIGDREGIAPVEEIRIKVGTEGEEEKENEREAAGDAEEVVLQR